jgi:hypothetical protein
MNVVFAFVSAWKPSNEVVITTISCFTRHQGTATPSVLRYLCCIPIVNLTLIAGQPTRSKSSRAKTFSTSSSTKIMSHTVQIDHRKHCCTGRRMFYCITFNNVVLYVQQHTVKWISLHSYGPRCEIHRVIVKISVTTTVDDKRSFIKGNVAVYVSGIIG